MERRLQTLRQKKAELMQQAAGAAKGGAEGASNGEALQQRIQMIESQIQTLEAQLSAAKTKGAEKAQPAEAGIEGEDDADATALHPTSKYVDTFA